MTVSPINKPAAKKAPAKASVKAPAPAKKAAAKAPAKAAEKKAPAKKAPAQKAEKKAAAVSYPAPVTLSGQTHPAKWWAQAMTEKGLSVAETERAMGVKIGTVYRVVRHGNIPTAPLTVRFSQVTGYDLKQLWAEVSAFMLAEAVAEVEKAAAKK